MEYYKELPMQKNKHGEQQEQDDKRSKAAMESINATKQQSKKQTARANYYRPGANQYEKRDTHLETLPRRVVESSDREGLTTFILVLESFQFETRKVPNLITGACSQLARPRLVISPSQEAKNWNTGMPCALSSIGS